MTQSNCRLQLRPKTEIDTLVFNRLKQGSDNVSAKGTRAISTHYLAETVAQIDPNLDNPKLRVAVIEAKHELEARLNLIESLFPALAPATPPPQPIWLSPHNVNNGGPVQSESKRKPEPTNPEAHQTRPGKARSETDSASGAQIDTSSTSWAEFSVVKQKNA